MVLGTISIINLHILHETLFIIMNCFGNFTAPSFGSGVNFQKIKQKYFS